ncbi:MAG: hypothetical protein LBL47_02170 [Lactobacillus sp.]|nr:hypothetical protein [Lactobacillus sp.]
MKKLTLLLTALTLFASAAVAKDNSQNAEEMQKRYPFIKFCKNEINEFCRDLIDYDLGKCMIYYEDYLGGQCLEAVIQYELQKWVSDTGVDDIGEI